MTEERNRQEQNLREFLEEDDRETPEELLENFTGSISRPPRTDPRHTDKSIPPGQRDVPAGGSTGEFMGGSAKKRKGTPG